MQKGRLIRTSDVSSVDAFVHGKIMELFRLYLVVGDMPAAVNI